MSGMLALATDLRQLNEMLEAGERLDQLVVEVERGASEIEIARAIAAECAVRGVTRERVEQVVIVLKEPASTLTGDAVEVGACSLPLRS